MQFNSIAYVLFYAVTFSIVAMCRRDSRWKTAVLILASLFFYGWLSPKILAFLALSVVVNFAIGRLYCREGCMRFWLGLGVAVNLLPLAFFKYLKFILSLVVPATGMGEGVAHSGLLQLAVPLGISYITFSQISYLVDVYRKPERFCFGEYVLSIVFWPKIIAGPIIRPVEFIRQWRKVRRWNVKLSRVLIGAFIFCLGLGKKVLIADPMGATADWGWGAAAQTLDCAASWIATLAYTLQLYFDFSGYSDMAWGSAIILNVRFPYNFDSPYKSSSIQEFWRRWHISLSRWLRDYLYFTFGGSRQGHWKTVRNVFLTFLIGGIWHGAGWTFIVWGVLHGLALSVNNIWKKMLHRRMPKFFGWVMTIAFVHVAWIFFRAPDMSLACGMLRSLAGGDGVSFAWSSHNTFFLVLFWIVSVCILWCPNAISMGIWFMKRIQARRSLALPGMLCGLVLTAVLFYSFSDSVVDTPFVYFRF